MEDIGTSRRRRNLEHWRVLSSSKISSTQSLKILKTSLPQNNGTQRWVFPTKEAIFYMARQAQVKAHSLKPLLDKLSSQSASWTAQIKSMTFISIVCSIEHLRNQSFWLKMLTLFSVKERTQKRTTLWHFLVSWTLLTVSEVRRVESSSWPPTTERD